MIKENCIHLIENDSNILEYSYPVKVIWCGARQKYKTFCPNKCGAYDFMEEVKE